MHFQEIPSHTVSSSREVRKQYRLSKHQATLAHSQNDRNLHADGCMLDPPLYVRLSAKYKFLIVDNVHVWLCCVKILYQHPPRNPVKFEKMVNTSSLSPILKLMDS